MSSSLDGDLIGEELWNANVESLRLKGDISNLPIQYITKLNKVQSQNTAKIAAFWWKFTAPGLDPNTINYSTFI